MKLRSFAGLVLQLAILIALLAAFFMRTPQVSGPSMEPHVVPGEVVLINTLAYKFGAPQRGDIVAFSHASDGASELFIKRVIGLPGERVAIDRGTVFVNGTKLAEPYVRYADARSFKEVTVPPGSIYVLGDNRANSDDSRFFGPVSEEALLGRALAGIWPTKQLGAL